MKQIYLLFLMMSSLGYSQEFPCSEFGSPQSFGAVDICGLRIEVPSVNPATAFVYQDSAGWLTWKPIGSSSEYVKATGGYGNFNTDVDARIALNKPVNYSGATNVSGVYSVTYPVAYLSTPNVLPNFVTTDPRDNVILTASSTTGFSCLIQRRVDVIGSLPTYSNRSGVTVIATVVPN